MSGFNANRDNHLFLEGCRAGWPGFCEPEGMNARGGAVALAMSCRLERIESERLKTWGTRPVVW